MLIKAGTYRFNDVLTAPVGGVACQLRFLTNFMGYDGVLCTEMQVGEYPELGFYVVSAPEELLEIVHAYGMALPTNIWVYSDGWNGFYGNGVKTVTIAEEQEVSDEFYAWFTANAVAQKEISGKWKFNEVLTYAGYNEVAVNFTAAVSSGDGAIIGQCDFLTYGYNLNLRVVSSDPDLSAMGFPLPLLLSVYNPEEDIPWLYDVNYIDFGAEPQSVSADFYNWLTENAVPAMVSITHNGTEIASIFPGQTATLKCAGMKMETDVTVKVAEVIGETGGSSNMEWFNDGNTHIWITLPESRTSPMLGVCPNGTVTVDWGDGTDPDILTGTSVNKVQWTPSHEYAKPGDYVITLVVVDGTMQFFGDSYGTYLLRHTGDYDTRNYLYQLAINKIELGDKMPQINNRSCHGLMALKSISISNGAQQVNGNAFQDCRSLTIIKIPGSIRSINGNAFASAFGVRYYDFTEHTIVPSLVSSNAFTGIPTDCEIRVPAALYDEWIAATNWSSLASQIVAV